MLPQLIPFFEENILFDSKERGDLIKLNKSILRDYLSAKIEQVGFKEALDSKAVQCIWNDLTDSIDENGKIAHRLISSRYYFQGLSKENYDETSDSIFSLEEFNYLAYGDTTNLLSPIEQFQKNALSSDKNFVNIPVSPMILESMDKCRELENRLLTKFVFNVPKGMIISDYYEKNLGLINRLPNSEIARGLNEYIKNSKDPIYEIYCLLQSYLDSSLGSEAKSIDWNETKVDKIAETFVKFCLVRGVKEMLELPSAEFSDDLEHGFFGKEGIDMRYYYLTYVFEKPYFSKTYENIKGEMIFNKRGESESIESLYKKFLIEANAMDYYLEKDYSHFNEESVMQILLEALENGEIDTVYVSNDCFLSTWSKKIRKKIKNNENKIVLAKSIDQFKWKEKLENMLKEDSASFKFTKLEVISSPMVFITLKAIFGSLFDWHSEDENEASIKEAKQIKLMTLISENKYAWFEVLECEVRIDRKLKKVETLDKITPVGLEALINLSKDFKHGVS